MKRLVIVVVVILALNICFTACQPAKVNVQVGTRVECEKCGKIIRNDTQTIEVLKNDASRYSVQITKTICSECELADFKDPHKVAQKFFEALRDRNMDAAVKYCDVSLRDDGGVKFSWMSFSPEEICPILAQKISGTSWKISKIFRITDEEGLYFMIVDTNTTQNQKNFVDGIGLGMQQVGEKWLIFKTFSIYKLRDLHQNL